MKKHESLEYSYQIDLAPENTLKPEKIRFNSKEGTQVQAQSHLKYISDILVGLTYSKLNSYSEYQNTVEKLSRKSPWTQELHHSLNPLYHLYKKSAGRLKNFHTDTQDPLDFEQKISQKIITFFSQPQISFEKMTTLIEDFNQLEADLNKPLLFNFSLEFSENFKDLLLTFYTFLFQLRSLVAINYNHFVEDHSQEGLLVDPLSDYLPNAEFIVNDAIIYWNFKKLSRPYSTQSHLMKPEVPGSVNKLLIEPTDFLFKTYNHNAYYLIQNIPQSVLTPLSPSGLEETLYLMTMDWLLGSPASLLFKIREELYGLKNSYEHIFWSDRELINSYTGKKLIVHCHLDAHQIQFMAA